jgi:ribokinase
MEVVGVGALNVDKLFFVERIASGGEEVEVKSWTQAPGGSAANTIVGLSRLGIETGFIGNVGTDQEGEYILDDLKKEGVDITGIRRVEGSTGMILGLVDAKGERALYAFPGVNDLLQITSESLNYARKAKMLHFSSFVGERSYRAQIALLDELSDIEISFAPGELYVRKKIKPLELIISRSSVIFLNKEEAEMLTDKSYERAADELLGMGAEVIVVTLGEGGCYVASSQTSHIIEAYKTKVVDTTGAGDAFAAGFLYGLLRGKSLPECGRLGNWVAARCISKAGARAGLPYRDELASFLG